ncbi:MAG: hypothetical protein ABI609_16260 [Acidobacteriota bacterium]
MRKLILVLFALVVLACGLGAAWLYAALHFNYSDGERAGYVQKFSRKGWLCKTWEGELAQVNLPGTVANVFPFSVRDAGVAARIEQTMGHRAVLHYEEHRGLPTKCFGETQYFITDVRLAEDGGGTLP